MAGISDTDSYIRTFLDGGAPSASHPKCDVDCGGLSAPIKIALRDNVTYIVAAVLINEADEVLFMQEAKVSCKGSWYLPAGRVERNESLDEAVYREVLEETGLEFKPTAVIFIESIQGTWMRVTYTGHVTGGKLKTTEEADKESLQAAWFPVKDGFPTDENLIIRAPDIAELVKVAVRFKESKGKLATVPVLNPYSDICFRFFITILNGSKVSVLLYGDHFPLVDIYLRNPHKVFATLTAMVFGKPVVGEFIGALSIEHTGKPHGEADGICITCLVYIETDKLPTNPEFRLYEIEESSLKTELLQSIQTDKPIPVFIRR